MAKNMFRRFRQEAHTVWTESFLRSNTELSKLQKFGHFCVMVWRSFTRNRCPVRASALAYATLLALIPVLAVVMSVTSTFLKKEGEDEIDQFIVRLVSSVTPAATVTTTNEVAQIGKGLTQTNAPGVTTNVSQTQPESLTHNDVQDGAQKDKEGEVASTGLAEDREVVRARRQIARSIHEFIQNTRSGALGVTGSVVLIFAAISMLSRIEDTFNDIWGVAKGRAWFTRIVLYWGVLSLAPLLVIVAAGVATRPHFGWTKKFLEAMAGLGNMSFFFLILGMTSLTFCAFSIRI